MGWFYRRERAKQPWIVTLYTEDAALCVQSVVLTIQHFYKHVLGFIDVFADARLLVTGDKRQLFRLMAAIQIPNRWLDAVVF
jgi:hypothetical protein